LPLPGNSWLFFFFRFKYLLVSLKYSG
jgi:hypothetical protein